MYRKLPQGFLLCIISSYTEKQSNARHHPRPNSTGMKDSVAGRRVHAVVRQTYAVGYFFSVSFHILFGIDGSLSSIASSNNFGICGITSCSFDPSEVATSISRLILLNLAANDLCWRARSPKFRNVCTAVRAAASRTIATTKYFHWVAGFV